LTRNVKPQAAVRKSLADPLSPHRPLANER
jgi:hypothetical protein